MAKVCDNCGKSVAIVTDCPSPNGRWWYVCDICHRSAYPEQTLGESGKRPALHTRLNFKNDDIPVRTPEQWRRK
jgi:hypothetical protein